jgi:hypothetical protein
MEISEESSLLGLLKTSKSISKHERIPEQKKRRRKKVPGFREFWNHYIRHNIDRSPNFKEYRKEFDFIKSIAKNESDFSFLRFKGMAEDCRKKNDKTVFLILQKFYREVLRIIYENPEIKNRYPKYWIEFSMWCQHILSFDFETFLQSNVTALSGPKSLQNVYFLPIPLVVINSFVEIPSQSGLKKEEEVGEKETWKQIKLKFEDS